MSLMKMLIKRLRCLIFLRTDNSLSKSQVKLSTQLIKPNNHTHSRLQEISEISLMGVKTIFFSKQEFVFFCFEAEISDFLKQSFFFQRTQTCAKRICFRRVKPSQGFFFNFMISRTRRVTPNLGSVNQRSTEKFIAALLIF